MLYLHDTRKPGLRICAKDSTYCSGTDRKSELECERHPHIDRVDEAI